MRPRRYAPALLLLAECASSTPSPIASTSVGSVASPLVAPRSARPSPVAAESPASFAVTDPVFRSALQCASGVQIVPSPTHPTDGRFGPEGPPPVVGTFIVLQPGCTLRHSEAARTDAFVVVLSGRVRFIPSSMRDVPAPMGPWSTVAMHASSAEFTAEGAPAGVFALVATGSLPASSPPAWSQHSLATQEDLAWAGGAFHARILRPSFAAPALASMECLLGSRDAPVLEHDHPTSWEVLAPLLSSGRFHSRQRGADGTLRVVSREVSPGQVQYVPPGIRHAWEPDGTTPLLALQSYTPPGPEERFVALAHPDAQNPDATAR